MKKFSFTILLTLIAFISFSQSSYQEAIDQGNRAFKKGEYKKAMNKYFAAEAFDPSKKKEIKAKIEIVFDKIAQLKKEAEEAKEEVILSLKELQEKEEKLMAEQNKTKKALAINQKIIDAFYFYDGKFALAYKKEENKDAYGFINKEGKVTIDYQYDVARPFNLITGFAEVKLEASNYLIDTNNTKFLFANSLEELTSDIEALDLTGKQLDSFPRIILQSPNLKVLNWNNNYSIYELPEDIGLLKNLVHFNMRNSNIKKLPESIGQMQALKSLRIFGGNHLVGAILPESLCQLKNLETLDMSVCYIQELPENIGSLEKLKVLNMRRTGLKTLPESIGNLKELLSLDLFNSPIRSLPNSIVNLEKLEILDLGYTIIDSLPDSIGQMTNLRELSMFLTGLSHLPESIGNLKKLEKLNLKFTGISTLPESIGGATNLKELSLMNAKLSALPASIGNLKNLEILDLNTSPSDGNPNQLKTLPESIGNLTSLTTLKLGYNKLTTLPKSIENLKKLQLLELRGNSIPKEELEMIEKKMPWCKINWQ